jgi:ankyrin repeat protein
VFKFLITRKANVNLAEPCMGFTALHYTSSIGNVPMIELLMSKGAKHDVRNHVGSTPLHFAAVQGHKEAVACLLDHGGGTVAKNCNACGKEDPDNTLRCIGCLAIHYCCEECQGDGEGQVQGYRQGQGGDPREASKVRHGRASKE